MIFNKKDVMGVINLDESFIIKNINEVSFDCNDELSAE